MPLSDMLVCPLSGNCASCRGMAYAETWRRAASADTSVSHRLQNMAPEESGLLLPKNGMAQYTWLPTGWLTGRCPVSFDCLLLNYNNFIQTAYLLSRKFWGLWSITNGMQYLSCFLCKFTKTSCRSSISMNIELFICLTILCLLSHHLLPFLN